MSSNALDFRHISYAGQQALEYIDGRRKGLIKSLKTSHEKLNKRTLGGFEWNKIITLAGLSGSGKSMILEQWKRDFVDLNPEQDFEILSFEFEMLGRDQVARSVSGKMNVTTKYLFSGDDHNITDEEYNQIQEIIVKTINRYPIYYVDEIGSVDEVQNTIAKFVEEHQLIEKNKALVVTLDHVLLTKARHTDEELKKIKYLYDMAIEIKKKFDHMGQRILFVFLSQLNRDIEKSENRILNNKLHYPQKTDLFGSSHIFFSSDIVIVSHRPAKIPGINWYGLPFGEAYPKGLPTKCPEDPDRDMIYWHVLKNRGDDDAILMMVEDFRNSRVVDYNPKMFDSNTENGERDNSGG